MSAIDLEEAMVLSPTREHEMFMARDQSELVVYYDQSTLNTDFLDSTKNTQSLRVLKTLYTAIQEFSFSKPLRRPPMLLSGGLDAWIDLFGPQSLIVGDSSAPSGLTTNLYRRSRDVARAPTPLLVERRAVLGSTPPYPPSRGSAPTARIPPTPINIEEEQRWLDQLHKENDPMPYPISRTNSDLALRARKISPLATNTNNSGAPVIRTVEEFVRQPIGFQPLYIVNHSRSSSNTQQRPSSRACRSPQHQIPHHRLCGTRIP